MKITREGFRLILATLLVGLASLNTGNNLMYLILSVMLAILFLSFFVTYVNLSGIETKIEQIGELYAGRPARVRIILFNKSRLFSARSFFLKNTEGGPFRILTYVRFLRPREKIELLVEGLPLKRGHFDLNKKIILKTGFPFIFTERTVSPELRSKLLIYPSLMDIKTQFFSLRNANNSILNEEEIYRIREYRYGDDRRWIHWKATAKRGELMIKDLRTQEPIRVTIIFDNYKTPDIEVFERSVSFAASLSSQLIEAGRALRFITCQKTIPFGMGREHLLKVFDLLAVINVSEDLFCMVDEGDLMEASILILQSEVSPMGRFKDIVGKTYYAREI